MTTSLIERLSAALEGRYRVERQLGEGGMATVYLAHDERHDRQVAIKVLRPELAAVVGAERFLAEIKTTANLHHPHILPLFDSGEADGFLFYVMPFVEGESLRERLERERQLPVEEAVDLARKVASALDYAHERGVVHRDVKPANILLSERGEPLVADFGIALAVSQAGGGRITETGLSLGTPHYMSPEQASGDRSLDPRSDVYALGCVLYEMLAGEPPYAGPTSQAVLARILTDQARPLSDVRKTVPAHVAAAVGKALEKTPADRFSSAQRFADALADPSFKVPTSGAAAAPAGHDPLASTRDWGSYVALGALGLAVAAFFVGRSTTPEPESAVARFEVGLPEGVTALGACCGPGQALSPDGEWLVYVGVTGPDNALYRRRLDRIGSEAIPGASPASIPFFSPDGRWVGFHSEGRLRRVPMSGGPPLTIASSEPVNGASWGDNDVIVYTSGAAGLFSVPAVGGTPTLIPNTADRHYYFPWILPGSEAALARINEPGVADEDARIVVVDLETGAADTLGFGTRAAYASGHLLISGADGTLMVQPFDPAKRRTTGQAVAILNAIGTNGPSLGEFAVSTEGTLVYQEGSSGLSETLVIRGGGGPVELPLPEPGNYEEPVFSPDGRRIAVAISPQGTGNQIWVWDRDQRTQQLLTVEGQENRRPVWTPDGSRIAFQRREGDGAREEIYWQPADGSGASELLFESDRGVTPHQFTSGGDSLLFVSVPPPGTADIGLLDVAGGTVRWLVQTAAHDYQPTVSPDGRWLAYTSERSGQPEVYVQAMDGAGGRVQVSAGGGHSARWAPDGSTLYFATSTRQPMVAARVRADGGFRVLSRETAFDGPDDLNVPGTTNWDVSPDGEEFLYIIRGGTEGTEGFVWILGWPELLREMGGP